MLKNMRTKQTNVAVITTAIFLTTFMTAIEGTIVSTAMPTIVSDLNGLEIMNWVVSIFLLMTAVSTPIYGKLADNIGRKPIFLFGLILFIMGSALCGLANNMFELIIFRVIQGLGSGAIQPVAITMLADMYTLQKRTKMLGLNSGFWGVASVIAPLLGGFIVQHLSWHWVFYINVPIGIATIIMVEFFFVESKNHSKTRLDYKGTTLLVLILLALMLFLQELGTSKNIPLLSGLAIVFIIGIFWFIKTEKFAKDPIMPLNMLKNKEFICQNLISLIISGVVIGFEFYIPTWMQGINGTNASLAGFAVTPSSLMWILGSFISGALMSRWGVRKLFDATLLIILLADVALLLVPQATPFWLFCVIAGFNGVGFGIIITISTVESQTLVSPDHIGIATSFNTLVRYLGQTMMVSIFGIVFNLKVANGLAHYPNLNQDMMNKIVNAEKAKHLSASLIPDLRNVLFGALKGVYWASLILVVLALIVNQMYQINKNEVK
ncbi:EmrB/QacA subfamily drug resistance transporter [Lactobacillus colini]|uniref:EmrB/QacA subfamily drug resistance transporter n=1 Tax=Lactobacillus colini TaxID=1819254 RepID=A0ABS4MFZ3_9LACO|nr:MDR family MFS transporter [Lactobacillus colini]MBP2058279.1 EmrB/QacA subfamily drug resistance transporter [Lactobacillus colini]